MMLHKVTVIVDGRVYENVDHLKISMCNYENNHYNETEISFDYNKQNDRIINIDTQYKGEIKQPKYDFSADLNRYLFAQYLNKKEADTDD